MLKKVAYVFVFLSALGFVLMVIRGTPCRGYSCLFFNDVEKYKVKNLYEDTNKVYRALLENGNIKIRLEIYKNISPETAKKFNQYKIVQMEGLFENSRSPYPGAISDEIACEQKYKPKIKNINKNGLEKTYLLGYLNNRLQYGGCIDEQNVQKSSMVLFYCQDQNQWYQLEIITPLNDLNNYDHLQIVESISCKNPT